MTNIFNRTLLKTFKLENIIVFALLLLPLLALVLLEPKPEITIISLFYYAFVASYFSFSAMLAAALVIAASLTLISPIYTSIFAALGYLVFAIPLNYYSHKETKTPTAELTNSQFDDLLDIANNAQIRDFETYNHSERVAYNSLVLARHMGLSEKQLDLVHWSALLHDIGKESIPTEILEKSTSLNFDEYEIIKNHANYGADVLASISSDYGEIAEIVRHHHEKWDGTGYPKKLAGTEIPILSRIIAVADVFEALTSKRPYKEPMRPVDAAKYIVNHSGSHFDPQIVKVFELCFAKKLFHIADIDEPSTIDLLYDSQVYEEFSQPYLELK